MYSKKVMEKNFHKYDSIANKDVLKFILDFNWKDDSRTANDQEIIRSQFMSGYCYYFAVILKTAFNRGEVCWCAPFSHICWVDTDGTPYDIEGVCSSSCDYYIPVSYISEGIADFMHVPGRNFGASEEYIYNAIEKYKKDHKKGE